jgi:hypothetical protein
MAAAALFGAVLACSGSGGEEVASSFDPATATADARVDVTMDAPDARDAIAETADARDAADAPDACPKPDANTTYSATPTVKATSSGSAAKGPYTRGGVMRTTSDAAAGIANDHAKEYDGATKFTGPYTITVDSDGALVSGTITLKTVNYTSHGRLTTKAFTTNAIKVTGVTLTNDCPKKLKSFTFATDDWYPDTETGAAGLTKRTLSGSMDLSAGTTTYTANYSSKTNGAVYTYSVTGTIAMPPMPVPLAADWDPTPRSTAPRALARRTRAIVALSMCPSRPPPDDTLPDGGDDGEFDDDFAPPSPDLELASAGTTCDADGECDVTLCCTGGVCQ